MPLPQMTRLLQQARPQAASPDTADTARAAADTLSFADRLRGDAAGADLSAQALGTFVEALTATLLDASLWIGLGSLVLKIIVILVLAAAAVRLIDRLTQQWIRRVHDLPASHPRRQRTETISNLISSSARYILWPVALIMVLSEVDVDVAALVATAGIAGLALGFGAQTLVKDVISGIFLLFDDSIHVGDHVVIGAERGTVEGVGVRLIRVRKLDGEMLMVPAGELRIFGNRSVGYARAVVTVSISYEQDVESILPVVQRVAREWAADYRAVTLEADPTVQSITAFDASGSQVRVMIQMRPGEQWEAERDLRRRLKQTFDEAGILLSVPQQTVHVRETAAPPRRVADPHNPDRQLDAHGSD